MIRVLHVIDTGGPGGAETVFLNTCTGLDPQRFASICMVSSEGWLADSLRARGHEPLVIAARNSFNVGYMRQIIAVARRERADVILAHLYGSSIYCSIAGRIAGVPVVCVLHGQSDVAKGGRFSLLKRLSVKFGASRLVFVSEKLRHELAAELRVAPAKCSVVPNGIDTRKFAGAAQDSIRRQLGLGPQDVLVGSIGNIRGPKAYEVLLRAAAQLRAASTRYHFVIAGEGGNSLHRRLLALRSELQLDSAVHFLGLRTDVADVLHNLDVFALSSDTEGFSIACIEAMAAGIPVVATRSGGPEEIVEHERSGLLVPTQDPAALAAAISRLATDRAFAAELARNALQRVQERYTLQGMIGSYARIFGELTGRPLDK